MPLMLKNLEDNPELLNQLRRKYCLGVKRTREGYRLSADGNQMKVAGEWIPSDRFYDSIGQEIDKNPIRTPGIRRE